MKKILFLLVFIAVFFSGCTVGIHKWRECQKHCEKHEGIYSVERISKFGGGNYRCHCKDGRNFTIK